MIGFILSAGNVHDAQAGRLLLETLGKQENTVDLLMDKAYEDDVTRFTAWDLKFNPVVPPKSNRIKPWEYDKELYKRRNEVERFFRRLKAYRGIGTRYDKLDTMFKAFIWLACICILLRSVNTP
jgi:transposase